MRSAVVYLLLYSVAFMALQYPYNLFLLCNHDFGHFLLTRLCTEKAFTYGMCPDRLTPTLKMNENAEKKVVLSCL